MKLHHSASKCLFVKCPGITRSMTFCWKQDKWKCWPPLMLISWQCLVLYSDFINKKRIVIWNGIILPLPDTGTFHHSIKDYLAPLFGLHSNKKKLQNEVPIANFCLFTAQMLPNLIVVVVKTSQNEFQLSRYTGTT